MIAEIARLEAENEALRKDAERYRWLRANKFEINPESRDGPSNPMLGAFWFDIWHKAPETHNREGLDAAIDEKIAGA